MAYTKPAQTGYAANLQPGEFVVKLDTTPIAPVAVMCLGSVDPNTGNLALYAYARVVKADGSDYLDVNNHPIKTSFTKSLDRAGVAALGGAANFRKLMMLTVAGEDVNGGTNQLGLKWINPLPQDTIDHANIRANIASAADAAANTDPSALL